MSLGSAAARRPWIKATETRASRISTADRTNRKSLTAIEKSKELAMSRKVATSPHVIVPEATRAHGSVAVDSASSTLLLALAGFVGL